MNPFRIVILCSILLLAACSNNRTLRMQDQLDRYQAAAGEPVPSFRYFSFNSWTPLGKEHLAVWTRPNEAWLIELKPFCTDLDFANKIALTSSLNRVYARFDKVLVGDFTCRIHTIRPINVSMLKDLQREARSEIEARNSDQPHQ